MSFTDALVLLGVALVFFVAGVEVGVRWTARRYRDQLRWERLRGR